VGVFGEKLEHELAGTPLRSEFDPIAARLVEKRHPVGRESIVSEPEGGPVAQIGRVDQQPGEGVIESVVPQVEVVKALKGGTPDQGCDMIRSQAVASQR
jgi:hypothetical protein